MASLTLAYAASADPANTAADNISLSAYTYLTASDATIAVSDGSPPALLIHGNSTIKVMRGSTDVSSHYATHRLRRIWTKPAVEVMAPGSGDPVVSQQGAVYEPALSSALTSDGQYDSPNKWFDVPGWLYTKRKTDAERTVHEFVVGVRDPALGVILDDPGCIYFIVVIEVSPTWYRIRMSDKVTFGKSDWQKIYRGKASSPLAANAPYRTEASTSIGWLANSDWTSWSTHNNWLPA